MSDTPIEPGITRRQLLARASAITMGAAAATALAACSSSGTSASSATTSSGVSGNTPSTQGSQAPSKTAAANLGTATVLLDVAPYGKHTPFYVAQAKGFWKDRGLDVNIQWGSGSSDVTTKIASNAGQFGFIDTSALIVARANRGVKTKLVCMYHYKNLMSAMMRADAHVTKPADLEGKTLAGEAADADILALPALAKINGFDASKVHMSLTQYTAVIPAVVSGHVNGTLNYYTLYPALEDAAKQSNMQTNALLYADYGVDVYNNGIAVTDDYLAKNPDAVKAFNAGLVEAVLYTIKNPDDAVSIFQGKVKASTKSDILLAQQKIAIDHMNVPEVQKNGFGPMDPAMMQKTLDLVNKYWNLDKPVNNVSDLYTNDYVPKGQIPSFSS